MVDMRKFRKRSNSRVVVLKRLIKEAKAEQKKFKSMRYEISIKEMEKELQKLKGAEK